MTLCHYKWEVKFTLKSVFYNKVQLDPLAFCEEKKIMHILSQNEDMEMALDFSIQKTKERSSAFSSPKS